LSVLIGPDLAWSFIDDTVHTDIDAPSRSDGYGGIEPAQGSGLTVGFRVKSRIYDQVVGQGQWQFRRLLASSRISLDVVLAEEAKLADAMTARNRGTTQP
jgi:hypothetical protein